MQITSQSGSVVIDYYPTKTRANVKLHDKVLKILTLNGRLSLRKLYQLKHILMMYIIEYIILSSLITT